MATASVSPVYPEKSTDTGHYKWGKWIAEHPRAALGTTVGLHLVGVVITLILWGTGVDVFPLDVSPNWPYAVSNTDTADRHRQYQTIMGDTGLNMWEKILPKQPHMSVEFRDQNIEVIYEGDCFARANLASMKEFEDRIYNSTKYQTSVCWKGADNLCKKPKSPLRFFDGSYASYFPNITAGTGGELVFRADDHYNRIKEIITDTAFYADGRSTKDTIREQGDPDIKQILDYHIGRPGLDYDENDPSSSKYCRTQFYVGYPLVGYDNIKNDVAAQRLDIADRLDEMVSLFTDSEEVGSLRMYYNSPGFRAKAYEADRDLSFMWMIGSGLIFWLGIMHLTKSAFIGTLASFGICGTWIWTNLIYRWILWVEYFGLPQHLGAFICGMFGINYTLLLFASWDPIRTELDDGHRIALALRKTNRVAIANAVIGAITFWIFCFSEVQVVMPFCLFLGMFCVSNYFNYYIYLPTVLTFYSAVLKWGHGPNHDLYIHFNRKFARAMWRRVVGHRWIRWIGISLSCVAIAVLTIFVANKLQLKKTQPKVWTSDAHSYDNFGKFEDFKKKQFGGANSDSNTRLKIVFGFEKFEKNTCHAGSFMCPMKGVYNEAFDLSSDTAQNQVLTFCDDLMGLDEPTSSKLRIRRKKTGATSNGLRDMEVKCWIKSQEEYFIAKGVVLPYNYTDMKATMTDNPFYPEMVYNSTAFNEPKANNQSEPSCRYCDTYYRHQEIGMLDWLTDSGNLSYPPPQMVEYIDSIGGHADTTMQHTNGQASYAGYYGSNMRYMTVEVNLTLNSENAEYSDALDVKKLWDDYVETASAKMMSPFQTAFQTCQEDRTWSWMEVQKKIMSSLLTCFIIGVVCLGIGVLVCTNNVILTLLTVTFVVSILLCVFGVYSILDWNVGIIELVNLSMVIGIAGQMSVPFALSYAVSSATDRDSRAQYALYDHFLPVYGGSFIAFLSACLMLASPLWYFWTFAVTFLCTVSFGILLGLLFFMALTGLLGPEHNAGRFISKFQGLTRQFSTVRVHPLPDGKAPPPSGHITFIGEDNAVALSSTAAPGLGSNSPEDIDAGSASESEDDDAPASHPKALKAPPKLLNRPPPPLSPGGNRPPMPRPLVSTPGRGGTPTGGPTRPLRVPGPGRPF
jgi:hypothetical protein